MTQPMGSTPEPSSPGYSRKERTTGVLACAAAHHRPQAHSGTIEDRILELQQHKATLVEALLAEETTQLRIDSETLSDLLVPIHDDRMIFA